MDFFEGLPPLEEGPRAQPQQSLFEGLESLKQSRILYRLCLVDECGKPVTYPSEADLRSFVDKPKGPASAAEAPASPAAQPQQPEQLPKEPSFQELLAETQKKGGPVCSHCGAT